jgi:hypothetical protein
MKINFRSIAKKEQNNKYFGVFPYVHFAWDNITTLMYIGWLKWAFIFVLKAESKNES